MEKRFNLKALFVFLIFSP